MARFLKKASVRFRLVSSSKEVIAKLKQESVTDLFQVCETLKQAVGELNEIAVSGSESLDIDAEFVNHFKHSTIFILKTLTITDVEFLKVSVEKSETFPPHVIARLNLGSEKLPGAVLLIIPHEMLRELLVRALKRDSASHSFEDISDFSKEMLNMIYSRSKSLLNYKKYGLQMGEPQVLKDLDERKEIAQQLRVSLAFRSELEAFRIEICPTHSKQIKVSGSGP